MPAHILLPAPDDILTDGVTSGFTVIAMPALVAVAGEEQLALLVITQLTTLPLASVLVLYVALLKPTFVPFTFHW